MTSSTATTGFRTQPASHTVVHPRPTAILCGSVEYSGIRIPSPKFVQFGGICTNRLGIEFETKHVGKFEDCLDDRTEEFLSFITIWRLLLLISSI